MCCVIVYSDQLLVGSSYIVTSYHDIIIACLSVHYQIDITQFFTKTTYSKPVKQGFSYLIAKNWLILIITEMFGRLLQNLK